MPASAASSTSSYGVSICRASVSDADLDRRFTAVTPGARAKPGFQTPYNFAMERAGEAALSIFPANRFVI